MTRAQSSSISRDVYNKIAIAYDGSGEADRALTSSITLAKSLGAELLIITVLKDLPVYAGYAEALDPAVAHLINDDHLAAFEGIQRQASERATAAGLRVTTHIIESSEVSHIVTLLKEVSADLLVVGLHRQDLYISRLWNTVYELAQDAPCNVLGVH
jgi:nucleotide-binding universal stress UspA family protein